MLLVSQIFKKFLRAKVRLSIRILSLKFRILYQENMILEEVARQTPRETFAPGIPNIQKTSTRESWESDTVLSLKFKILCQENMILEEVARQTPRDSCVPGIPNIKKIFTR